MIPDQSYLVIARCLMDDVPCRVIEHENPAIAYAYGLDGDEIQATAP